MTAQEIIEKYQKLTAKVIPQLGIAKGVEEQAKGFGKAFDPVKGLYNFLEGWDAQIQKWGYESQALITGYATNPATGERIKLSEKDKEVIAEDIVPEITRTNMYYHLLPQATQGMANYWIPKMQPHVAKYWSRISRRVLGKKWTPEKSKALLFKINTPRAKFSDTERLALGEIQKVSKLEKTPIGKLIKKSIYLRTKPPTPQPAGALPFHPTGTQVAPTITAPKAKYPITPAGKLATRITPTTTPKGISEPPTAGVPTFLKPKTLELMARKAPEVTPLPVTPTKKRITLTDLERRFLKAREGKDIEYITTPKKELPMTKPYVRVHKPQTAKSLIEKFREISGREEPTVVKGIARGGEAIKAYPKPIEPHETRISPLITTGKTAQATKIGYQRKAPPAVREGIRTGTPMEATPSQVKEIVGTARKKLLIRGAKIGKGFIRLAQNMTGKSRVSKMTQAEAETFIDALKKLSLPRVYKGRTMPPAVPVSKKIVPQEFFRSTKFRTPTIMKLLTPQTYYTQKLGIKKVTEQLERGKMRMDMDKAKINREIDRQINKINKMAKGFFPRVVEKIGKKIIKKPTNAVAMWRHILSTSEKPPAKLPDGTIMTNEMVKTFDFFRKLTRSFFEKQNEIYIAMGEEPIHYLKGYVKRVADETAQEMLQGTYPFPEQLKYWSKEVVGRRIHDPSKLHRKLAVDLEELWTRDLGHAMKAMVHTGLKVINLNHPLQVYNEQMGVLAKDKSVYENLPPEQKKIYDEFHTMPARTRKWADNFINEVIKGQMPLVDEEVNQLITGGPLKTVFNKLLAPFGRALGRDPITKVFQMGGRMMIHGVMGPVRPKQLIRNKFQLVQNTALYGVAPTIKGLLPSNPTLKGLLDASLFLQTYTGLEELPQGIMSKAEALNLKAFQWTAVSNARQAMKAAYHNRMKYFNDPKYKKYGYADPKRTYQEPKDFLYDGEKDKMLAKMEWGAGATQYHYIAMGMPQMFRYKVGVPMTRLQSWWQNHIFKFQREALSTFLKGVDGQGDPVAPIDRVNYLKYMVLGGGLLVSLGYERSYTYATLPTNLPPTGQFMLGAYKWVTNQGVIGRDTKWKKRNRKQAEYLMFSALQAHIPGYLLMKDVKAVWEGKKPLASLFAYMHKIKGKWGIGYLPEIKKAVGIGDRVREQETTEFPEAKSRAELLIEKYRR